MKSILKNVIRLGLIGSLCAVLGNSNAKAQQQIWSTNLANNASSTSNNVITLLTNGTYISQIRLMSGAFPVALNFYDYGSNSIGYTTSNGLVITNTSTWYTTGSYATNVTDVQTNSLGAVQTNIYPGWWNYIITNTGSTNYAPVIGSFAVPANAAQTFNTRTLTTRGLTVSIPPASSNIVLTLYYAYPF